MFRKEPVGFAQKSKQLKTNSTFCSIVAYTHNDCPPTCKIEESGTISCGFSSLIILVLFTQQSLSKLNLFVCHGADCFHGEEPLINQWWDKTLQGQSLIMPHAVTVGINFFTSSIMVVVISINCYNISKKKMKIQYNVFIKSKLKDWVHAICE